MYHVPGPLNSRQNVMSDACELFVKVHSFRHHSDLSRLMGKPTICIGKNKDADQLRSNCEADQGFCFRYSDSTIPLLLKSKILSF